MATRLKAIYEEKILPELRADFALKNVMQVPRLQKIVVNMGVGDAQSDPRVMESAMTELSQITGQKPSIRKARKSIAGFKVREGAQESQPPRLDELNQTYQPVMVKNTTLGITL